MKPTDKQDSNIYYRVRNELKLSREKASELLETISPDRLERIENEKMLPSPEDVMTMAEKYAAPDIRNYYCAKQCPLGQQFVPEVKISDLEKTVLKLIASLNSMHAKQERLIEIAADGEISENEIRDFISIEKELQKVSIAVEALELWMEKMLTSGQINEDVYNSLREE